MGLYLCLNPQVLEYEHQAWGVGGGRAGGGSRRRQPLTAPATTRPSPRIFGFEGADAEDVIYVNWLNMVRAGLLALEFYTPETSSWRQVRAKGRILGVRIRQPYLPSRYINWV